MSIDILQHAADLYKRGDKKQAQELLAQLVKQEPQNAGAWYGLAVCHNDTEQRRYCLHKVLEISPNHAKALQMLESLQQGNEIHPVTTAGNINTPTNYPLHQKPSAQQPQVARRTTAFTPLQWITLSVLGLLLLGGGSIASFYLFSYLLEGSNQSQSIPTLFETSILKATKVGVIILPNTWTPLPTNTKTLYPTLRPTFTPIPTNTSFVLPTFIIWPTSTLANTQSPQSTLPIEIIPNSNPTRIIKTPKPQKTKRQPAATPTRRNNPTKPPKTNVSCGITPSVVPGATPTNITFYANFSPPKGGLGFDISFDQYYSGQKGCAGVSGIDGYASCDGRSGMLPYRRTVKVTFSTSVGECIATYKSSSQ